LLGINDAARTNQGQIRPLHTIPILGYFDAFASRCRQKALDWVGPAKEDFLAFPLAVQRAVGNALGLAQFGGKHPSAKPWKGEGPGVFEVVDDFDGDTYRAVYTVRFRHVVYVLHAFQKKSPRGKRTARSDIELITRRLKVARQDYEARYGKGER
jgi:phage-related protein